ncbi:Signal transduction histidine kinase involved in nitrogen fixation and metabolism regulation [Formivibrio citricus]|uniref:histidine kinase n=1 Tax=Formivibrio citricus TaxID=83765 RepID=A0A1I4XZL9_9NEIS|nr:ATP-binding protein [Formivibrio citricus]SFN30843.1 Signal transduction histidine kinase involved in nitrogen fixation and metabolism regulation [Formivibrio citricus]
MKRSLLLTLASVGAIMIFLLATAAGNASAFSQYFSKLLWLNALLLAGLALLVGSRLWTLQRHVRAKVFGSRLMLRMVLMFTLVAVLPGAIVYTLSVQFLNRSIETWFDDHVDSALDKGLNLGNSAIEYQLSELARKAKMASLDLHGIPNSSLPRQLGRLREQSGAQEISLFEESGLVLAHVGDENASLVPQLPDRQILRQAARDTYKVLEKPADKGLMMRVVVRIPAPEIAGKERILQMLQPVPRQLATDAELVEQVRNDYKSLSQARRGLKMIYSLTLTVALLMAMLGALALAIFLSGRLAEPLSHLAAGTRAVAQGDFTQQQPVISRDELGILTHSFNRMTRQLADARHKLERNQAEQAAAKAYVEAILGSLSAGVISFDENWKLQSANQSAYAILGVELTGLSDVPLAKWPELRSALSVFCEQVVQNAGKDYWQGQVELSSNNRVLLVHGTRLLSREDDPEHRGYVLVFDDVTELLAAQRDAAWGEVARRLAHEIKNPLTPIQLAAERLEFKLTDQLDQAGADLLSRNTQTIVKQVGALKQMVDAFRDYARKPSGKRKLLDLQQLLAEVLVLYEAAPVVCMDMAHEPLILNGDITHLRQVIHNLLQNAQDAIQESANKQICVRIEKNGSFARLTIEDSGPGFNPEVLPRAFEPYVTSKTKGTGLGLAIVKKIVEEHQGSIQIGNREPQGAFVRIELPLWEDKKNGQA